MKQPECGTMNCDGCRELSYLNRIQELEKELEKELAERFKI
jgi:hypothetical protein